LTGLHALAQESVAPVGFNPLLRGNNAKPAMKTTLLTLPFFEDFSGGGLFPDPSKWEGRTVYINNTMGFQPITRGVATFDALNAKGGPYDSFTNAALRYADSLTSLVFDMSAYAAADSIYLSFFYQPQGNGFSPEAQDSLILYLKRLNGSWTKVWGDTGDLLRPFRQVMVPVTDPAYFHSEFQFRFVNKASININDDVWNLDYIRMGANRTRNDTAVNDLATATEPSFILSDYTAMPYRQFSANMSAELGTQHWFYVRNNYLSQEAASYGYSARETTTNTPLFSASPSAVNIPAATEAQFQFPVYPVSFNAPGPYSRVVFEQAYFASHQPVPDSIVNDTIRKEVIFDNYLAYDDGTAEKSYFLNQFATLPAKIAIEFHLNQPDTLRGVAIYFGRQVPLAANKFFSVGVWDDIAINGGTEQQVYQQDLLFPGYVDTVNHFWVYRFDEPVPMGTGTFYLGTIQPAASGSDSLYIGLDVNRIGGNHLYFDVNGYWESSIISGALMVRPIFGQPIFGTEARSVAGPALDWSVYPNPVQDKFRLEMKSGATDYNYEVTDMQGRVLRSGAGKGSSLIDLQDVSSGIYFVRILSGGNVSTPKKIIKL
jgi:hypothetical protein